MNTLKISLLFLVALLSMTSCKDEAIDLTDAYIGQWSLVDASGDGTVAIAELGSEFDTKIVYESSDAYVNINEDNTLDMGGELMVTMELYLAGVLVSSELTDLGELGTDSVWSLDSNDNFQSPEFDEITTVTFDGNVMTVTTSESINMDGVMVFQEIEFVYEKNL